MRWNLALVLGLLASGAIAVAVVRAQDGSISGGGGGLRSRPTPATPLEAPSALRNPGRSSSLAERLQQVGQSVTEEYTTGGAAAPGLLQPMPEGGDSAAGRESGYTPYSAGVGVPSVLKRGAPVGEPAPLRTAAIESPVTPSAPSPAPAAASTSESFVAPSGARPLGSPPPGSRTGANAAPATTPLAPPGLGTPAPSAEEGDYEATSSRRRISTSPPSSEFQASPPPAMATPRIDALPMRSTTGAKVGILVGTGPQLHIEALGPKAVVRGRPASYTMIVSNTGEAPARGVAVHIESRQVVEFAVGQATHGAAELHRAPSGGTSLAWFIAELPRGAKAELTVSALSREARPFELLASWTCQPSVAASPIDVLEPQLAMTLSGPKDVMFGETKIYTITLTNPGTGDVENVLLALAPLSSSQEAPQPRNIGALRAGERKEIPIQLTAREAGLLSIRAEATADGGLRADAMEQVTVRRARLDLAVEGSPLKYAGSPSEYRLRLANVGNAPAEEVAVVGVFPPGVEYVPGSDGGTVQTDGVAWRIGSLAPGDERILHFVCTMHDEGEKRISLQARGSADLVASAATVTRVEALADLKLVVNDPAGAIPVGKEVIYEVRVLNRGTKAASGIEISGYFSEGIEPISADGLQAAVAPGQVTAAPVSALEAGRELVLRIKAKADQPGNHIFRAVVQCANPETRLATEETTRFFGAGGPTPNDASRQTPQPAATSPFQPAIR